VSHRLRVATRIASLIIAAPDCSADFVPTSVHAEDQEALGLSRLRITTWAGPDPYLGTFVGELAQAGVPSDRIHYAFFRPADELVAA
jgi:ferredoxin-NADP reductase